MNQENCQTIQRSGHGIFHFSPWSNGENLEARKRFEPNENLFGTTLFSKNRLIHCAFTEEN